MFNAVPSACLIVAPDFTIVGVSDAHLHATGANRAQIVGRKGHDARLLGVARGLAERERRQAGSVDAAQEGGSA